MTPCCTDCKIAVAVVVAAAALAAAGGSFCLKSSYNLGLCQASNLLRLHSQAADGCLAMRTKAYISRRGSMAATCEAVTGALCAAWLHGLAAH